MCATRDCRPRHSRGGLQTSGRLLACARLKNSVEYHSDDNTDHKKTENAIWVTLQGLVGDQRRHPNDDRQVRLNGKKDVPGIQWTINITNGTDTDISGASIKDALGNGWKSHPAMWY